MNKYPEITGDKEALHKYLLFLGILEDRQLYLVSKGAYDSGYPFSHADYQAAVDTLQYVRLVKSEVLFNLKKMDEDTKNNK
ncbi:hypothetical protein AGMMS49532_06950 [Endomicrobiia bacterium]|nr:hypothetical protein AGMMS49532_06950 [Endomicrobiia bacterium]